MQIVLILAGALLVVHATNTTCHHFPGLVVGAGQLAMTKQSTAEACCDTCGKMPNCAAWTWHSDTQLCFPKNNAKAATGKPTSKVTSGLHPGPTCTPKQQPSMCPGGKTCPDCNNADICPCSFDPAAHPTPAPVVPPSPACTPPHDKYKFCNTSLSFDARVADLLTYVKDEQKPNLLTARGGPHGLQNLSSIGVPAYYWGE
jgi:hypothetical protein